MAKRKGERTARTHERDCPHLVEMPVPDMGFGQDLWAMDRWHAARGIERRRGRTQRRDSRDYCRWCFAEPDDASAFQAQFGGVCVHPERKYNETAES